MTVHPVCLTVIAARSLREELFDYLSEQRDLVSGFTASDGAGHGPTVRLQTSAEQVKGHADEVLVRTILEKQGIFNRRAVERCTLKLYEG